MPGHLALIEIRRCKKRHTSGDDFVEALRGVDLTHVNRRIELADSRAQDPGSGSSHEITSWMKGNMISVFFSILFLICVPMAALADIDLPVENGVVTSGVGWRRDPFGSGKLVFHRGIDIAVPVGTPVRAVRKGRVVFAGASRGYGSTVIVEHANGDRTLYGHNATVRVNIGELVESGTVVAFSGNTGRSTGPHVHFEQMPSGRSVVELAETEDTALPQLVDNNAQRYMLEQKMDESLNSILKTVKGTIGQDG